MMPVISICIPTYNRKHYLSKALESAFAQTYKDYEVTVLDDGSTDGTGEMIKNAGYDFRYYRQENQGEARTCNRLIELARGKYISFLHSDDLLFPDAIERMVNAAESQPDDVVVYGNYFRIDEHGNICGKSKRKLYSGNITDRLFADIIVHPNGSIFPKKALQEAGGFDTSLKACYDYKLELKMSLKYRFVALDKPTFMRRRHSSNNSQDSFANRKTELDMLSDFYYNGGGKEAVPKRIAMKRLSQESYRAGRYALKENLNHEACGLLEKSFKMHPNMKLFIHWMRAILRKKET